MVKVCQKVWHITDTKPQKVKPILKLQNLVLRRLTDIHSNFRPN